jgi:hypothetical protein
MSLSTVSSVDVKGISLSITSSIWTYMLKSGNGLDRGWLTSGHPLGLSGHLKMARGHKNAAEWMCRAFSFSSAHPGFKIRYRPVLERECAWRERRRIASIGHFCPGFQLGIRV